MRGGQDIARGYAGRGEGKNNPAAQTAHNFGPLPCGFYAIEEPVNTAKHGPYVLPLTPHPDNVMFGRGEFLCHGDKIDAPPGSASEGCIILNRIIRNKIWESGDHLLEVVAHDPLVVSDVELGQ